MFLMYLYFYICSSFNHINVYILHEEAKEEQKLKYK